MRLSADVAIVLGRGDLGISERTAQVFMQLAVRFSGLSSVAVSETGHYRLRVLSALVSPEDATDNPAWVEAVVTSSLFRACLSVGAAASAGSPTLQMALHPTVARLFVTRAWRGCREASVGHTAIPIAPERVGLAP